MTEEFLHYLWKFRLLNKELTTRSGESLTVIHPGEHNPDGGPDFLNARIRVGGTLWAGNIEMHVNEADWFRHNHHEDKAYENVVLHVVYEENPDVAKRIDERFPALIITGQYPENIFERYREFLQNRSWIPCEKLLPDHDPFYFQQWSPALLIERLEDRASQWRYLLEANRFDWAETLHQIIARSFGLKINTLPFELLAKALPLKIILKYKVDPFKLEALAFGQAGMLTKNFQEEYPRLLKDEYGYLADKHSLSPLDSSLWKFLRLRPPAFPTIRIAQWASLLQQADHFFDTVIECQEPEEIIQLFSAGTSEYWDNHFVFEKQSPVKKKYMGISSIHLHILNTIAPFIYLFGHHKGIEEYREKAISLIERIPGEKNSVVVKWKELGFPADNALATQALIQLKSGYCDRKKCLECRIGVRILMGLESRE